MEQGEVARRSVAAQGADTSATCEFDPCLHMEVTMGENARARGVPDNVREPIDKRSK